jgi:hypothetical protein
VVARTTVVPVSCRENAGNEAIETTVSTEKLTNGTNRAKMLSLLASVALLLCVDTVRFVSSVGL